MIGYVAREGNRWYAVIYHGLDPRHRSRTADLVRRRSTSGRTAPRRACAAAKSLASMDRCRLGQVDDLG
jgi:hypothetical protein